MSEEEIMEVMNVEIKEYQSIGDFVNDPHVKKDCFRTVEAYKGILDLYKKEKEKNKLLQDNYSSAHEDINWFCENYISKKKSEQKERKAYIKGTNDAHELCNKMWKDKIKALIEERKEKIDKLHPATDCVLIDELETEINVLEELIKEE